MPTTYLLFILGLLAASVIVALTRKGRLPVTEEDWPDVDIVVDLEFLRSRPAELEQRISELVALSGGATLGARMRSMQVAAEPSAPRPTRIRRRAQPLVASR